MRGVDGPILSPLHLYTRARVTLVHRMTTLARRIALVALLVMAFTVRPAQADGPPPPVARTAQQIARTAFLGDRLKYPPKSGTSDDFRVRTNAALSLGQSDDDDAVEHLCRALEVDPSEVVRQAVAAALKRLQRKSAIDCLRSRQSGEASAAVKLQITRAVEALEAQPDGDKVKPDDSNANEPFKPKNIPTAKYYVSVSPITNNTDRAKDEIQKVVLDAVRSKLEASGQFQVAPENETPAAAKAVLGRRKIKGYYLSLSVDGFDYSDGNLRVRMKCAVFTYPNKDLRGHFTPGATQQGVRKGDRSAEDNLLSIVSGAAVDQFAQSVEQFAQAFR